MVPPARTVATMAATAWSIPANAIGSEKISEGGTEEFSSSLRVAEPPLNEQGGKRLWQVELSGQSRDLFAGWLRCHDPAEQLGDTRGSHPVS